MFKIDVVLQLPLHSQTSAILSYQYHSEVKPGAIVRVPLGKRLVLAIVVNCSQVPAEPNLAFKLREVNEVLSSLGQLNQHWLKLTNFSANYYQRHWGEIALSALPSKLKELTNQELSARIEKLNQTIAKAAAKPKPTTSQQIQLTPAQQQVMQQIQQTKLPVLLFGVTGSGKTEIYLELIKQLLLAEPEAQVLIMVPEINLTPQLGRRVNDYFAPDFGDSAVVTLHSSIANVKRLNNWLLMRLGKARILLGTRLSVLASIPKLRLIVVDEEHDSSYKQQDGARYSARDLAVYRHKLLLDEADHAASTIPPRIILGSATPSLESWQSGQINKYQLVELKERVGNLPLPQVRIINMQQEPLNAVLSPILINEIQQRIAQQQQVLLFLNRRGYSHILCCKVCNWKSECPNCSAFRVFHKIDNTLRCHHCGDIEAAPQFCPKCGSPELEQLGQGTEFLEEQVRQQLAELRKVDGAALQICRIDSDNVTKKGDLERHLALVHSGATDVLIGTQMIARGHDFQRVTLVAAINPDQLLFSSNFRAPEQLFALLEQAAGRAGRSADFLTAKPALMLIQTQHPEHPIFSSLKQHDYPSFAAEQLQQRQQAMLPPFIHHALLRSNARSQQQAQDFLRQLKLQLQTAAIQLQITLFEVVPTYIQRVANVERAQLLIEADSRKNLHQFLNLVTQQIKQNHNQPVKNWFIDVDPLII